MSIRVAFKAPLLGGVMMKILQKIKFLLDTPSVPESLKEREGENLRDIVSSRSHGNIYLQWGQYYLKRDIDDEYQRVSKIDFAEA